GYRCGHLVRLGLLRISRGAWESAVQEAAFPEADAALATSERPEILVSCCTSISPLEWPWYSVIYFVEIYFDLVKHYPPSEAGIQLLLYTPGLGAGVYISMFLCNTWPRQTSHPLFLGSIVEAVGVGLMAWALYLEHTPTIFGMIALTGVGTGLRFMPCTLHAIGFFPQDISSVVAIMGVAYTFGGTMGLTDMTTVFNNVTPDSPKNGIVWAFVSLTPFMVICILGSACLGNVNITKGADGSSSGEVSGSNLIRGSYVLVLLKEENKPRKEPVDEKSRLPLDDLETEYRH
ncbi:hypothetical protein F5X96DRAFT_294130, partial [Biscogniauxia mediterranea]